MKEEYNVRLMQLFDLPQVHAIEELSFPSPWSRESLTNELTRNPVARYIVIENQGEILAYAGIWLILEEGHITNVAVHPKYRRQGLGRAVLERLLRLARCYGIQATTLEVRPSNLVAINLYLSFGFEITGERPGYYTDTNEDALLLWKRDIQKIEVSEKECISVYGWLPE
ncbi:MAG: ribosomal protein S18-alanine N-acetyltransferase [Symbiobacteriaceae bacterium]|nr:ribosomal protein S18-alanine N-acetyltransferase [Symbiobacteriaceae bacterium]